MHLQAPVLYQISCFLLLMNTPGLKSSEINVLNTICLHSCCEQECRMRGNQSRLERSNLAKLAES
jgi:hypothetical protein